MTQYEIALQAENKKLQDKLELMRNIATRDSFHQYFFKNLSNFKTRKEAFDHFNHLYFEFFGAYIFTDYTSFRQYISRKLK